MDFYNSQTGLLVIIEQVKTFLFKFLTKNGSRIFLKGGDIISIAPQIGGEHDPILSSFIAQCAKNGHSDFLIDIGANIGLISCQTGFHFSKVHLIEPNPLCVHVLSVNAFISLEQDRFEIHPVALGDRDSDQTLNVPRHNWGGAFVKGDENSYSEQLLAQKDGFSTYNPMNYFEVGIKIVNGSRKLREIFTELEREGKRSGVIKIDVEGLESAILNAIARSLPEDWNVIIVFENWDVKFDPTSILRSFEGRANLMMFQRQRPWPEHASKLRKAIALLANRKLTTSLLPWNNAEHLIGDMVLEVKPLR